MKESIKKLLRGSAADEIEQQKKTIKTLQKEVKKLRRDLNKLRNETENKIELIAPEEKYEELLGLWFRQHKGKVLDLDDPRTMDEKIQWMKLNRNNERKTTLADKYEVREFIRETIGEEYLIPLLGVYDKPEEVPFDELPEQFVLKSNHGALYYLIVKNKNELDVENAVEKMKTWLSEDYAFKNGLELHYSKIDWKIIVEKYMEDSNGELNDYKFYCFGPHVECVIVCIGRGSGRTKFYFFDREWNLLRYNKQGKEAPEGFTLPKPENIDEMFEIAGKLSEASGEPFVRVDLYNCDGKIYFGEMTFTPNSGADKNRDPEIDLLFGEMIHLG